MKKVKIESAFFDIDSDHILSAMPENIVVLRCSNYDIEEDVVVYITRELYHKIIDAWLDDKQGYYEREGHYAGVGQVSLENLSELPKKYQVNLLYWVKDEKEEFGERAEYKPTRVFTSDSFIVDMEHG